MDQSSSKFIKAFATLSDSALQNPTVVGRLSWSKFKRSSNKPNLFYRSICKQRFDTSAINISFYYYENGKRKEVTNDVFSSLIKSIDNQHEQKLRTNAFNKANGYDEEYFRSLEKHYARIQ